MRKITFALSLTALASCFYLTGCPADESQVEIIHDGETIAAPTTWSGLHQVVGSLTVHATLTIDACSTIRMGADVLVVIQDGGALIAVGEPDCPISFISAKQTPAAGDWEGFWFYETSNNSNELSYVELKHAGGGNYGTVWIDGGATIKIANSSFDTLLNHAIEMDSGANLTGFANNSFTNIAEHPITLYPQEVAALTPITTSGNAKNRVYIFTGAVTSTITWPNVGVPYEVETFDVTGGTLEVAAGITLYMVPTALVSAKENGALELAGTALAPIVMQSAKTTPTAGDWEGIWLYDTSSPSSFAYATISHGGGTTGTYGQTWIDQGAILNLDHVTFTDGMVCDLDIEGTLNADGTSTYTSCIN